MLYVLQKYQKLIYNIKLDNVANTVEVIVPYIKVIVLTRHFHSWNSSDCVHSESQKINSNSVSNSTTDVQNIIW
jgi:hypothetical protein